MLHKAIELALEGKPVFVFSNNQAHARVLFHSAIEAVAEVFVDTKRLSPEPRIGFKSLGYIRFFGRRNKNSTRGYRAYVFNFNILEAEYSVNGDRDRWELDDSMGKEYKPPYIPTRFERVLKNLIEARG
jgi:hypothetical protein